MKFTLQKLAIEVEQAGFEQAIAELGKIDCSNEYKYIELNEERNKCIRALEILEENEI